MNATPLPPRPAPSAVFDGGSVAGEEDPGAGLDSATPWLAPLAPVAPVAPDAPLAPPAALAPGESDADRVDAALPLTNAELVQMQVRVIALENLVMSLLAEASEATLVRALERAACIQPRAGATPHHLTTAAAAQMEHLVDLARQAASGAQRPPSR